VASNSHHQGALLTLSPYAPSRRRAINALIGGLWLVGLVLEANQGSAQSEPAQRSVLEYARWAERVLSSPPAGIELLPALEDRFAERVIEERRKGELGMLRRADGLQRAARAHAADMLERDYTGHIGPAGRSVIERVGILDRRFIGSTGENLAEHVGVPAAAIAEQVGPMALQLISGFLESPEHRKNLLEPSYTHHGIGAAASGDRLIVVHVFGDRRAALAQDLSLEVAEGAELPFDFEQGQGLSAPAKYGFARPGEPAGDVVPLDVDVNEVAVDPDTYQLQFFLPTDQSDRFLVAPGPIVVVQ
jgi:uncharacterized protein YkwD